MLRTLILLVGMTVAGLVILQEPGVAFGADGEVEHRRGFPRPICDVGPWLGRPDDGRPHGLDVVHGLCGEGGWGVEDLSSGRAGRVVWARLELNGSRS